MADVKVQSSDSSRIVLTTISQEIIPQPPPDIPQEVETEEFLISSPKKETKSPEMGREKIRRSISVGSQKDFEQFAEKLSADPKGFGSIGKKSNEMRNVIIIFSSLFRKNSQTG